MMEELDMRAFEARHGAFIDTNAVRWFGLMLPLHRLRGDPAMAEKARLWSGGEGAACAVLLSGNLTFGELDAAGCDAIAERLSADEVRRVHGSEPLVRQACLRLSRDGAAFSEPMPLRSMSLARAPRPRPVAGSGRLARMEDLDLASRWLGAFQGEALPDRPGLSAEERLQRCMRLIAEEWLFVWEAQEGLVSMAAIVNLLPQCGAISLVYTPPASRGRGFAGAAVAAAASTILASGRPVCLYVDARNPISARCYAAIGFETVACHAEAVRAVAG